MAQTRHTRILLEADEEVEARLQDPEKRKKRLRAVESIRAMNIPFPDWDQLEEELLDARSRHTRTLAPGTPCTRQRRRPTISPRYSARMTTSVRSGESAG